MILISTFANSSARKKRRENVVHFKILTPFTPWTATQTNANAHVFLYSDQRTLNIEQPQYSHHFPILSSSIIIIIIYISFILVSCIKSIWYSFILASIFSLCFHSASHHICLLGNPFTFRYILHVFNVILILKMCAILLWLGTFGWKASFRKKYYIYTPFTSTCNLFKINFVSVLRYESIEKPFSCRTDFLSEISI